MESAEISTSYLNDANKTSDKLTLKAKIYYCKYYNSKVGYLLQILSASYYNRVYCYVKVVSTVQIKANVCYMFFLLLLFSLFVEKNENNG